MKEVKITLETINKAISFLGKCPYQEVHTFLPQLIAEANKSLTPETSVIEKGIENDDTLS